MSIEAVTFYRAVCDWPGCGVTAQDDTDYAAWAEKSSAVQDAKDAGWWTGIREVYHYCNNHPGVWESDLNDGVESAPTPPYLLIQDHDDPATDGHVVLITPDTPTPSSSQQEAP